MGILHKLAAWVRYKLEASHMRTLLDVDCPHDPLNPCDDCFNMNRALNW